MDVPKLYPLYHIETQKQDGTWVRASSGGEGGASPGFLDLPLRGLPTLHHEMTHLDKMRLRRFQPRERIQCEVTEGIEVALLRGGAAFVGCPACEESFSVGYPQEAPVGVSWAGPVGVPLREG